MNKASLILRLKAERKLLSNTLKSLSHTWLWPSSRECFSMCEFLSRLLWSIILSFDPAISFSNIVLCTCRIKNTVLKEKCRWDKIHNKKLDKLHSERRYISKPKYRIVKNIINNFSWYTLTLVEEYVLFSLDQHIPTKNNTKNIKTEFERFSITYRNIQRILIKNYKTN